MEASIPLLTGLVLFAASIVGLITRLIEKVNKVNAGIDEVHVMVNSRMEEALSINRMAVERIDQLVEALRAGGIEIPDMPDHDPNPQ